MLIDETHIKFLVIVGGIKVEMDVILCIVRNKKKPTLFDKTRKHILPNTPFVMIVLPLIVT